MPEFLSDQAIAERVLAHIPARTTDRGTCVWREPVENYGSAERLEAELQHVLRRFASPFCPSQALPEPGSFIARSAAGIPLLVVRGRDGCVRAFRNACRHRGTELAKGAGCARAFVCPYHGWSYGLDGRLVAVPHEDGFPDLDRTTHGLVPVHAEERHGLVFVAQHPTAEIAGVSDDLPTLILPEQQLLRSNEFVLEANWKIHLESFIEGYHIRFAHPKTFYPYGFDNLNVVELNGWNSRVTYPFRRIEGLADVRPEERVVDGKLTYVYHVFPNALVTVLSRHTNLVVLEPIDPNRTRVYTYQLTNRGDAASAVESAERDSGFVAQTGALEDVELVTSIQRSIGSGANEHFTFGHFESAIVHFHRNLAKALASAPAPFDG